jgi:hypothetical protein
MAGSFIGLLRRPCQHAAPPGVRAGRQVVVAASLAVAVAVAGCGSPAGSSAVAPKASRAVTLLRADDSDGGFRLSLELPKDTWRAGEAIEGNATLAPVGGGVATVSGSGTGLLGFEYAQIGGDYKAGWGSTLDCVQYSVGSSAPLVSSLRKAGMYEGDAGPTDFNRLFAADPLVHLPLGDWTVAAVSDFTEGAGCTGMGHGLRAEVIVHVVP